MTHDPSISAGMADVSDETWVDVMRAVDRTYAELVDYQTQLEARNAELDEMRSFMASVFASVSDVLIVVDRHGTVEQAAGSFEALLGIRPADVQGQPLSTIGNDPRLHDAV